MKQRINKKFLRRALLILAITAMTGCATHSEVDNLTDADLCNITGQAVALGDKTLVKETGAEMIRRGTLTVTRDECELIATYGMLQAKGFNFDDAEEVQAPTATALI
ncbi:hypothetical protein LT875_002459 [Salmonella enterica]|nr:hypothetical protein [Salmonella enterica]